jgi:hypothetical protein
MREVTSRRGRETRKRKGPTWKKEDGKLENEGEKHGEGMERTRTKKVEGENREREQYGWRNKGRIIMRGVMVVRSSTKRGAGDEGGEQEKKIKCIFS